MTQPEVLYRYVNVQDVVLLEEYRVVKRTPKGCWCADSFYCNAKKHFVLDGAKKRFAYPTKEEAKVSFLARKRRQLGILRAQIEDVEAAVKALNEGRLADYAASRYVALY